MNDKMKRKYVFSFRNSFLKIDSNSNKKNMLILNTHAVFKGRCCLT